MNTLKKWFNRLWYGWVFNVKFDSSFDYRVIGADTLRLLEWWHEEVTEEGWRRCSGIITDSITRNFRVMYRRPKKG